MENKIVIVTLVLCSAWIVYGDVDCSQTGNGIFADPADTTCRAYVICTLDTNTATYQQQLASCDTGETFDVLSSECVSADTNPCTVTTTSGTITDIATIENDVTTETTAIVSESTTDASTEDLSTTPIGTTDETRETTEGPFTESTVELTTETFVTTIASTTGTVDESTTETATPTTEITATTLPSLTESTELTTTTSDLFTDTTETVTTISDSTTVTTNEVTTELTEVTTQDGTSTTDGNTDTSTFVTESSTTDEPITDTTVESTTTEAGTQPTTEVTTTDITTTTTSFTCSSVGRFPNSLDSTCQTYYLCTQLVDDTFSELEYSCPSGSYFDPTKSLCSSFYSCATSSVPLFICTSAGRFADNSDGTCRNYYFCIQLPSGSFARYDYVCPSGSYFDPSSGLCKSSYICASSASSSSTSTTTEAQNVFTCTSVGRFANPSDSSCGTYIFCVGPINGIYTGYQYTCPTGSYFNPTSKICTSSYTCSN